MQTQTTQKRTNVDIDTRRAVFVIARARKPEAVAEVNHETFIRNALKDRMGWPRREQAPESIKVAAKQMAATLVARDAEIKKAKEAQAAQLAASEQVVCDQLRELVDA